jgi:hypothetical protein
MVLSGLELEYTLPHISLQSPITTVAESTLNKSIIQLHSFFPSMHQPNWSCVCLKATNKKKEEERKERKTDKQTA